MTQGLRGWLTRMVLANLGLLLSLFLLGCQGSDKKPSLKDFPASLPAPQLEPTVSKPKTGEPVSRNPQAGLPIARPTLPGSDSASRLPSGSSSSSPAPGMGVPVLPTSGGTLPLKPASSSNGGYPSGPVNLPNLDIPNGGLKNPLPPEPPAMPGVPSGGGGTAMPIGPSSSIPVPQMPNTMPSLPPNGPVMPGAMPIKN
jgi:hypothetical protein